MERADILKKINDVFIDNLDNEDIVLTESSSADDIEEWDSLTHVQLVVAVEKKFGIRFTAKEIQSWKNIGDMINSVEAKS